MKRKAKQRTGAIKMNNRVMPKRKDQAPTTKNEENKIADEGKGER